jgi:hypothetical protein
MKVVNTQQKTRAHAQCKTDVEEASMTSERVRRTTLVWCSSLCIGVRLCFTAGCGAHKPSDCFCTPR